jgi:murein DD-endopeptidase MepM/ murein hydrolase activator NlpD
MRKTFYRVLLLLILAMLWACYPMKNGPTGLATPSSSPPLKLVTATLVATATWIAPPSLSGTKDISKVSPTEVKPPTVSPTPTLAFRMCSPLSIHPLEELPQIIGSPYKPPPPNKKEERHHGVDFAYYHYGDRDTMLGEPVQSVLPGRVAASLVECNPYGNFVIIETPRTRLPIEIVERLGIAPGQSLYLLYAHLNKPPLVNLGDEVEACQLLGEVGMSGFTEIPHLHLETRLGPSGKVFAVMRFYDTRATQEEMDNYVLWRTSGDFQHFDPMTLLTIP